LERAEQFPGFAPDIFWKAPPRIGLVYVYGYPALYFNALGVIFYTDIPALAPALKKLKLENLDELRELIKGLRFESLVEPLSQARHLGDQAVSLLMPALEAALFSALLLAALKKSPI
jgi:hypothetical protein